MTADEAIQLCCHTKLQNSTDWILERKKRITASKCYELYTYESNKNPNWPVKIGKLLLPTGYKIPNCEFGKNTDAEARQWYQNCFNKRVTQLGFVVHPNSPFLGCSPDGCCFEEGKLIEIKCAVEAAVKALPDVLPKLKYLSNVEGIGYNLKKNTFILGKYS